MLKAKVGKGKELLKKYRKIFIPLGEKTRVTWNNDVFHVRSLSVKCCEETWLFHTF